MKDLPVSVELNGKVSHHTHGFVGESHLHLYDPSSAGKCARNLQAFGLHGWEPNLQMGPSDMSVPCEQPLVILVIASLQVTKKKKKKM